MAIQNGPLNFTGSLADLSFYRRKDSNKTFVRQKSGPTRKQILHDPRFTRNRMMGTEWEGCTLVTKWLRRVLHPLDAVRDHNFAGPLNALVKSVQKLDTEGTYGQRSIQISRYPHGLEGFTISRQTPLDTLLRTPLQPVLQKEALSAQVQIPEISYGFNFYPQTPHPYFRVLASLGIVPDVHYAPSGYAPRMRAGCHLPHVAATGWAGVTRGLPATMLELQLPNTHEYPTFSLVLAVGISFGTPDRLGNVQAVNYTGSGRIIKVA
jgi:hypothetical protein